MCNTVDMKPLGLKMAAAIFADTIRKLEAELGVRIVVADADRERVVAEIAEELRPDIMRAGMMAHSFMDLNRGQTIQAIKHVRNVMGWGLMEAKNLVEAVVPWDHKFRKRPEVREDPRIELLQKVIAELEAKLAEKSAKSAENLYGVYIGQWRNANDRPRAEFRNLRDAQLFASGYDIAYGGVVEIFDSKGNQYAFEV